MKRMGAFGTQTGKKKSVEILKSGSRSQQQYRLALDINS